MCAERRTDKCVSANRQTDRQTEGIDACVCVCVSMCVCVCVCMYERMSDQVVCSCSGRDERERTGSCSPGDRWTAMLWTHTHTLHNTTANKRTYQSSTAENRETQQHASPNRRLRMKLANKSVESTVHFKAASCVSSVCSELLPVV